VGTQTSESATAGFCSNAAAAAAASASAATFLLANSARRRSSAKDVAGSRSGGADASGPANGTGESALRRLHRCRFSSR
jgi:hypothetical protein